MKRVRVIPLLMIDNGRAVVTRRFKRPVYVGDPLNAIRIFNEKEVDELFIVDITRKPKREGPDFDLISKMASESFMPVAYGGKLRSLEQVERIITCGIEKVSFNTALFSHPDMIMEASYRYGKQSIIASVDFRTNWLGKKVIRTNYNTQTVEGSMEENLRRIVSLGVGEIFLNSIDKDGTFTGYDEHMIRAVSQLVNVPLVACGGASSVTDFKNAVSHGASATAAGAMFYFKGSVDAVLINYPNQQTLRTQLYDLLD
jgi:imidazole glycerol-phosphate synthase subunit HisF